MLMDAGPLMVSYHGPDPRPYKGSMAFGFNELALIVMAMNNGRRILDRDQYMAPTTVLIEAPCPSGHQKYLQSRVQVATCRIPLVSFWNAVGSSTDGGFDFPRKSGFGKVGGTRIT